MKTNLMQDLTEAFAVQGYRGKQLTLRVLAAGHIMALAVGNTEVADRLAERYAEEEGK